MEQLRKGFLGVMLCVSMLALAGCGKNEETEMVTEQETAEMTEIKAEPNGVAGEEGSGNVNGATSGKKAPAETGVLEDAGDDLKNGAEDVGKGVKDGVEDVGEGIKDGAEDIGDDLKKGSEKLETEKK